MATEWFDYVFRSPNELEEIVDNTPWVFHDLRHDGGGYCVRLGLRGSAQ